MKLDAAGEALLTDAREAAARLLAAADDEAAAALERARQEGEQLVAAARARGEAEGRAEAARELARNRALARMEVLGARRALYDELRRRARETVLSLREEPGYGELLERLAAAARSDLGEDAALEIDPAGSGGVRARAGSRRVDYTLPTLADRCVSSMGQSLERLWAA